MELLSVLILAGGKSVRMGQDKATLSLNNVPLLTRTCRIGQDIAKDISVLSSTPAAYAKLLPAGVKNMRDAQSGRGPLWALHQGLDQCQTQWLLLLACDLPYLDRDRICQWRSHLTALPSECLAYVPRSLDETSDDT
ncbi:MAG: NTP transferase domain-containing protein, partial [Cyanobacteria bacterium P01_F01_bin.3]